MHLLVLVIISQHAEGADELAVASLLAPPGVSYSSALEKLLMCGQMQVTTAGISCYSLSACVWKGHSIIAGKWEVRPRGEPRTKTGIAQLKG